MAVGVGTAVGDGSRSRRNSWRGGRRLGGLRCRRRHRRRFRSGHGLLRHRDGRGRLIDVDDEDGHVDPVSTSVAVLDPYEDAVGLLDLKIQDGTGRQLTGAGVDAEGCSVHASNLIGESVAVAVRGREGRPDVYRGRRIFHDGAMGAAALGKGWRPVGWRCYVYGWAAAPLVVAVAAVATTTTASGAAASAATTGVALGVRGGGGVVDGQRSGGLCAGANGCGERAEPDRERFVGAVRSRWWSRW